MNIDKHSWTQYLELIEIGIPIIFFMLAHFIDVRINALWSSYEHHPNKWIKQIYHYQWEFAMLITSLFYVYGIKLFQNADEPIAWIGLSLCFGTILISTVLLVLAFIFLGRVNQMNAIPFYYGCLAYILLTATFLKFQFHLSWEVFGIISLLCSIPLIFLVDYTQNHIRARLILRGNPSWNKWIFRTETNVNKKIEVVKQLIDDYIEVGKRKKAEKWIAVYESHFPDELNEIATRKRIVSSLKPEPWYYF